MGTTVGRWGKEKTGNGSASPCADPCPTHSVSLSRQVGTMSVGHETFWHQGMCGNARGQVWGSLGKSGLLGDRGQLHQWLVYKCSLEFRLATSVTLQMLSLVRLCTLMAAKRMQVSLLDLSCALRSHDSVGLP